MGKIKTFLIINHFLLPFQRVDIWNSYTMRKACEFDLPILAVHQHPLASPYKPQDSFHFKHEVFRKAEDDLMDYLVDKFNIDRTQKKKLL